jgi:hypothetical protein
LLSVCFQKMSSGGGGDLTDSDRTRTDEIFDALLADVDKFTAILADPMRDSAHQRVASAAPTAAAPVTASLNENAVKAKKTLPLPAASPTKKIPPTLPAKSPANSSANSSNANLLTQSAPVSVVPVALSRSISTPVSSTVVSSPTTTTTTTFKVHCGSQYTVVKCAIPDASVSDLLALVKKKRALQASDAISPAKEYCLVRYGTFEILDPSTRLADLLPSARRSAVCL